MSLVEVESDAPPARLDSMFGLWSACAFAVVLPGTWGFAAGTLSIGIYGGGPAIQVWGALAVGMAISIVCIAFAEYGSAYPSASGCIHIAYRLNGPKNGPLAGYSTGCLQALGVIFTGPALMIVNIQLLVTCFQLFYDWQPARWQLFLMYQAENLLSLACLRFGTRLLPGANLVYIVLFVAGLLVTIGLLLGYSDEKAPNSLIWKEFHNNSGFDSNVLGAMVGLLGPIFAYGPPHWLLNMAEDIKNPSRNVPIAILAQQVGNILTLFVFYIAAYYSVTDFTAIIETTMESAIGALYLQGTKSPSIALGLVLILFIPGLIGTINYMSATIRLLFGFLREGPVPGRAWFSKVDHKHNIPFNVLYTAIFLNFLLGFLYLGSSFGFSIIIGSATAYYSLGYLPLFIPVVLNRRKYFQPSSHFSLPWGLGMFSSAFAVFWELFTLVEACLPLGGPVTVETFNYTVIFIVFGVLITMAGWFLYGKSHYLPKDVLEAVTTRSEDQAEFESGESPKHVSGKMV